MAERAWAFVQEPNGRRNGIKIECASCEAISFFAPNSGGRFPPKAAETHFRRDGWTVGKGPRRDFCPACTAKAAQPQHPPTEKKEQVMAASPSQTPPRTMSRDDRRLIIAEVKGCYDEEKRRYMDGWHDEKVARTLGAHVPVAWVREVREDYFGEGASNEQFDELLRRQESIQTDLYELEKNVLRLSQAVAALKKSMDSLAPLIRDVKRAVGK